MKKKVLEFIILMVVLTASITSVSASYSCSNGSSISEDMDEIDTGEKQTIGGLGIGLIHAEDTAAFNRFTAELMIDAKRVSLDNQTNSEEINLLSGDYNINLVNSTDENAIIKVGSSSKSVNKGESEKIGDLEIFLVSTEAAYPNAVTLLAGKKIISLSSDENPSEIVTISNKDYAVELYSASDNSASIRVKKCNSGDITETKDAPKEDNKTNTSGNNISLSNNQTRINNQTSTNNTTQQEGNNSEGINRSIINFERFTFLKNKKIMYYGIGIIILIILIFVFLNIKWSKEAKELKEMKESL